MAASCFSRHSTGRVLPDWKYARWRARRWPISMLMWPMLVLRRLLVLEIVGGLYMAQGLEGRRPEVRVLDAGRGRDLAAVWIFDHVHGFDVGEGEVAQFDRAGIDDLVCFRTGGIADQVAFANGLGLV